MEYNLKEWYEQVDFIQDNMQFYSYSDFRHNAMAIRRLFLKMKRQGKKLYQWYVFANTNINQEQKRKVWDFLNCYLFKEKDLD